MVDGDVSRLRGQGVSRAATKEFEKLLKSNLKASTQQSIINYQLSIINYQLIISLFA